MSKARVLSESELKRVMSLSKTGIHGKRNYTLLQFSYRLGLRAKEMAALYIRDVVDHQGKIRDDLLLTVTKGGRPRTLFLTNQHVRNALKDYLDERKEHECILYGVDSPLFKSQKGSNFSPNTMQQLFHRLYKAAGIDGARSHSGRRHFATSLIFKGVDIKSVSVLMGHSSVNMTAQYSQDNPQMLRRILSEMI